ncbi:Hsp20/alpha crystallin family protein [Roseateles cellulosilyticus]|uniref:Hsp20/alpha crystallin family protein n=1 Tax=Pelomonas cellulosilytica TaxID=2906762 RepID=A0ABS8XWC1_9BURK|nr:Hsp20/alpha crystallin family protein [Pelomonas sp. P8]MCE4555177.1 Hsp20/alpha crystallin family protein [Pelomonas sp. P8]
MSTHAVQTDNAPSRAPARPGAEGDATQRALLPRVDVSEDDTGITLLADLPGVAREQLALQVEGDTLLIEGSVAAATPGGLEPVYAEVRVPRFRRSFTLSRELDASRIEAQLRDGVLTLRIPKQAHAQPRRIAVSAG